MVVIAVFIVLATVLYYIMLLCILIFSPLHLHLFMIANLKFNFSSRHRGCHIDYAQSKAKQSKAKLGGKDMMNELLYKSYANLCLFLYVLPNL